MKEKKLTITERINTTIRMLMYLREEIETQQPKKEHIIWFLSSIIDFLNS